MTSTPSTTTTVTLPAIARGWLAERLDRAAVAVENLFGSLWWSGAHGWGYEHPARWVRNMAIWAEQTGMAHPGLQEVGEELLRLIAEGKTDVDYAKHQLAVYNHEELLMGLLACYRHAGDARYLEAARRIGRTIADGHPVNRHYYKQLAIGRLLELAAVTDDPSFTAAAVEIADDLQLEMLSLHAHGAAAGMIGSWFVRLAGATGDAKYLDWARQVWQAMKERQMATGGIGEMLTFSAPPGESDLHDETCQTAWWLLFNLELWNATGETSYLDLTERIFFNHFLFHQLHRGEDAGFGAMGDIDQGYRGSHNYICCDNEGFFALQEMLCRIWTVDYENRAVSAHFILPAETTVTFTDGARVGLRQESAYPVRGEARIRVSTPEPAAFSLRVRIPGWTRAAGVYLNGQAVEYRTEGSYVVVERSWNDGDSLSMVFPMPMRVEADISGAGADARQVVIDGIEQPAKRVAILHGPLVAALFRAGHGNDLSWVWTGDYPEVLDTGGCPHLGYPASKPDYLVRDGETLHTAAARDTIIDTAGLPTMRWMADLGDARVNYTVTVLPGLPLTLEYREVIRGWDGRGELLCGGLRYALRKTKKNLRYTAHLHQRAYPEPMVTTKPDISDITGEEYGNGTFSRFERLEDRVALPVTGSFRLDNGYFRTICLYDPAQVVCRRTEDWVGVYLQPQSAAEMTITRRLVFPLAEKPLCQTMVKQQTERGQQVQATLEGEVLTLSGPVVIGAPVLIQCLPGLHAGMILSNACAAAILYDYDAEHFIARVDVPASSNLTFYVMQSTGK